MPMTAMSTAINSENKQSKLESAKDEMPSFILRKMCPISVWPKGKQAASNKKYQLNVQEWTAAGTNGLDYDDQANVFWYTFYFYL
jgi:hypothetical protein